jgi:hypothetical protein
MSKFVIVKEAPAELKKGEYLIDKVSFLPQIVQHKAKAPRNNLTGLYHMRMIVDSIGLAYDPDNMTAYAIKAHKYEGLPYSNDEELNTILVNALQQDYPAVFPKYLEVKVRNRPKGTEKIIYVDSNIPGQYEIFYRNGLAEEKAETTQKTKSDRVVGKPAVTKEQAEALKTQAEN